MAVKINSKVITNYYALYCGDCCQVLPSIKDESVGFSIHSPPFASLYSYSDDPRDLSNCKSYSEFLEHYGIIAGELFRTSMPGRIAAVHCMCLPTHKSGGEEIGVKDFPGDIIRLFISKGWIFHCPPITIWKDPLVAATRTKALGLAHKQIVKDSTMCRTGIADQLLAFRKPGINPKPVAHPEGLAVYHGSKPVPMGLKESNDQGKNKRSHWIWQQYASPVWMDIRQTKVLPFREGKDPDDMRHIAPLQLDVVERCLVLWSAPGDIVLTPFMGVGSEVYCAVRNGRKGVGIELKKGYFNQAVRNVKQALIGRTKG